MADGVKPGVRRRPRRPRNADPLEDVPVNGERVDDNLRQVASQTVRRAAAPPASRRRARKIAVISSPYSARNEAG